MSNESFWSGSSKTLFFMGLILGLAVSSIVALIVVTNLLWSGKSLGGARAVDTYPTPDTIGQPPVPTPVAGQPVPPADPKNDHIIGAKNAKVTLIEYSDFECPFCKRFEPTIAQVLKEFPNDVRVVYRHFPLSSIHPNAEKAGEASEGAAKLAGNDGFWKMHTKLFERSPDLAPASLVAMAKEIGLNESAFKTCLDSGEMASVVAADYATGNDSGVEGTPATFINGKLISGAVPFETMKAEIQAALK